MKLLLAGLFAATLLAASGAVGNEEQRAVDGSVAAASAHGIGQSIAVVDRASGQLVAGSGADQQYISESIVKLFTVAYYELAAGGAPDEAMSQQLRTMIEQSDDDIESQLWTTEIVPTVAERYGLAHTSNGPKTGPHDWGWELITAGDVASFLYQMSIDPEVGPLLTDAMANVASTGADGFDQDYGLNALPGDHGSKQGWTDVGEATDRIQIHSVGWTDQYFVAILQTSTTTDDDTMRTSATNAAQAILAAEIEAPATPANTTIAGESNSPAPEPSAQLGDVMRQFRLQVRSDLQRALGLPSSG